MFCVWRTVIAVGCSCFHISPHSSSKKKDKKKHRYGIDGVVVNGFGRAGGFDRGEQRPLSFSYVFLILNNQDKLDSNEYVIVQISIY